MQNIFKRKKAILFSVIFSSLVALAGCSSYEEDTSMAKRKAESRGTVTDKALYYPRKTRKWFSEFWDRHVKGVPPDWQKYMDLGQPRRPIYNPGGKEYMNQPGEPVIVNPNASMYKAPGIQGTQGQYGNKQPLPSGGYGAKTGFGYEEPGRDNYNVPQQPQYAAPVQSQSNSAAPAYVPPPSFAPVDQPQYTPLMPSPVGMESDMGGMDYQSQTQMQPVYDSAPAPVYQGQDSGDSMPWLQGGEIPAAPVVVPSQQYGDAPIPLSSQGEPEAYNEGDVVIQNDGYVPAPVPPWERDANYMGIPSSNSQDYQPVYQGGSYEPSYTDSPYNDGNEDLSNVGGVADPYEPGGFEGGFNPPSYDELERMGGDPFAPMQNKYIRVFEPMNAEYYYDEDGEVKSAEPLKRSVPLPVIKKKTRRSVSKTMFPLEEYAPKSSIGINNYFSKPADDNFVSFSNKEKVNKKIDELIIKLGGGGAIAAIDKGLEDEGTPQKEGNDNKVLANTEESKESGEFKIQKLPNVPVELAEEDKPFVLPKVEESDLAAIEPSENDIENPQPVKLIMPGEEIPAQPEKEVAATPKKEVVANQENPIFFPPAVERRRPANQNVETNLAPVVQVVDKVDEEFEKVKLGLLPIENEKIEVTPINSAEIAFPKAKQFDKFAPIDLAPAPVQKVGAIRVEPPLLEVPEISKVGNVEPEFNEVLSNAIPETITVQPPQNIQNTASLEPVFQEPPQIVVVTPAKNEYIAPPVVNIRKQFEEYKRENQHSGFRLLRKSRYSDRRGSSY